MENPKHTYAQRHIRDTNRIGLPRPVERQCVEASEPVPIKIVDNRKQGNFDMTLLQISGTLVCLMERKLRSHLFIPTSAKTRRDRGQ